MIIFVDDLFFYKLPCITFGSLQKKTLLNVEYFKSITAKRLEEPMKNALQIWKSMVVKLETNGLVYPGVELNPKIVQLFVDT